MVEVKSTSDSRVIHMTMVQPEMTNTKGNAHGGNLAYLVDNCSGMTFAKHSHARGVTASIDHMNFIEGLPESNLFTVESFVTGVGTKSCEVYVQIIGEDLLEKRKFLALTAFVTYVAIDPLEDGLPGIRPENDFEAALMEGYEERRQAKKAERAQAAKLKDLVEARLDTY